MFYHDNFISVVPILKQLNIKVAFKYNHTLKNLLIKHSPNNDNNVIYRIPCLDCNLFYVGQTSKNVSIRTQQHKNAVIKGYLNNALAVHNSKMGHGINWSKTDTIIHSNDFIKRNILESFLISHTKESNLNISPGLFSLDPILSLFLKSDLSDSIKMLTS